MNFKSTHSDQELKLKVVQRNELTDQVIELLLGDAAERSLPNWEPGSHIDLLLNNGMNRQYSLMRQKHEPNLWKIAVLIDPNGRGGSSYISENLLVGTEVNANGPRNHFGLVKSKSYHFIAGGIGITPLIPMIEFVEASGANWSLAYLGRSKNSMPYLDELTNAYPNNIKSFSKLDGQFFEVSKDLSELDDEVEIYCCGPQKLMNEVECFMEQRGKAKNIHLERFSPKEISENLENHPFTVICAKSGIELHVPEDESIFMAADFEGIELNGDCMEGTCGSCETKIISGIADHRDSIFSSVERKTADTMMICVSRAVGTQITLDM